MESKVQSSMIPRIVIAGTHSGCGKTSIASGIMAALSARGLSVQPFKVGPDFIDPTHHTAICRRVSRNLDPYMMGEDGVIDTFLRASSGADIAVIEGVMGMYDGLEGTEEGSTAHVAKILRAPVLLIIDVSGMSRSANALAKGYCSFDTALDFAGIIFNCVGSSRHQAMIEESCSIPVFGWIPWQKEGIVESRHLGLQMAHETNSIEIFGEIVAETCDLDAIVSVARSAPGIATRERIEDPVAEHAGTIGIAHDAAFCFYYQDNLDLLRTLGAKLVFFSPISDHLPDVDGVYIGGGYPELYAEQLENSPCRHEIAAAIHDGMPAYAECGGLIYLSEELYANRSFHMAGILPARAALEKRFVALGYVDAVCTGGTTLLPERLRFRGHEFHYTSLECDPDARFCFALARGKGISEGRDGLAEHDALAGYTHAYFTRSFAESLLGAIQRAKRV